MPTHLADLRHALTHLDALNQRLAGREPAVFLDYDGTLTPIVDRPEDAVISDSMRAAVRDLAERCTVCVVSGRDRAVVQELMELRSLVVAGSHGFDIWASEAGTIEREEGRDFEALADDGIGIGIFVGDAEDPERAGRPTAADYLLHSPAEVEQFLDGLAR